jgi:hypothetical protein
MNGGSADDYLAIDYSRLVAIMIEATKERQKAIQQLFERIAALEQKMN